MRYRGIIAVGICGFMGLLGAGSPRSASAQHRPTAQLSDVPRLRSDLRSADPRVRTKALSTLNSSISSTKAVVQALAPQVRRMAARDRSCKVRVEALRVLVWRRKDLRRPPHKAIRNALFNSCPLSQTRGADWVERLPAKQRRKVVRRLLHLADRSPYYKVQCRALVALGKLRVKKAEKLMARALTVGTTTGLAGGRTRYMGRGGMPQCAVRALEHLVAPRHKTKSALVQQRDAIVRKLKGKMSKQQRKALYKEYWRVHLKVIRATIRRPPPVTVDQVRRWRNRLSKRNLVSRSPPALCLKADTCAVGSACLNMTCVPNARALKAYLAYRKRRPPRSRKTYLGWRNDEDPLAVRLGLGMGAARWIAGLTRRRLPRARISAKARRHLELRNRARQHWLHGQCGKAIGLARQAYKLKPSSFTATLIGSCACSRRDRGLALWAHRRLRGGQRRMLERICNPKGIRLP